MCEKQMSVLLNEEVLIVKTHRYRAHPFYDTRWLADAALQPDALVGIAIVANHEIRFYNLKTRLSISSRDYHLFHKLKNLNDYVN